MEEENIYVTKRGIRLRFIGIQPLIESFFASHQAPPEPQYEVSTLGGRVEQHSLMEVKDRSALSPDELQRVIEYEKELQAHNLKATEQFLNLIIQRGLEIDDTSDEWAKEQTEQFGIKIPDDPKERRRHYIKTEVLCGSQDEIKETVTKIILGVTIASGADREKMAELQAIFRRQVGLAPIEGTGDQGGPLDIQLKVSTSGHRDRKDGKAHKLVRRTKRVR